MFKWGISWHAYTAYIAGILINIVGFAGAVGAKVPKGAQYIYNINFFCGFIISAGVYYLLCWAWPLPEVRAKWSEPTPEQVEDILGFSSTIDADSFSSQNDSQVGNFGDEKEKDHTMVARSVSV